MKYKKEYFNWQKEIGVFGGNANKFKFEKHIDKEDVVIDFGSGGGYLLNNIICKEKIGIEINKFARVEAKKSGINSVESMNKIKDNYVDVIIPNHALEHTGRPLDILKQLYLKLKKGGKIIFVVPYDGPEQKYNSKDINQHLYTWNRQTLGNLFKEAGFTDIKVYNLRRKWSFHYLTIYNIFGLKIFDFLSYLYALFKNNYQIKIMARK